MFLLRSSSYDEKFNPININTEDNSDKNLIIIPQSSNNDDNIINQLNIIFKPDTENETEDFYKINEEINDDSLNNNNEVNEEINEEVNEEIVEEDNEEINNDNEEEDEDDEGEDDDEVNDDDYDYLKECYLNDIDPEFQEGDIYVISINNCPYFYENTLKDARNQLWNISKRLSSQHENTYYNDDSINMLIDFKDKDNINLLNNYNLWFFTLNSIKYELKIDKVKKYSQPIIPSHDI